MKAVRKLAKRLRRAVRSAVGRISGKPAPTRTSGKKPAALGRVASRTTADAPLPALSAVPGRSDQDEQRDRYADGLRRRMGAGPWVIDAFEVKDDAVEVHGWAIPPAEGAASVCFTVNGLPVPNANFPLPRPDIKALFWFVPQLEGSGYNFTFKLADAPSRPDGDHVFAYQTRSARDPLTPGHVYYYNPRVRALPIPDAARRKRVHGGVSEGTFLLEGYTTFRKLELVLQKLGRTYESFPRILDWGCGSGRLTRNFASLEGVSVTGVDIDADNARWCSEHLGFGQFSAIPMSPPTQLARESFDLLIGISIFTHLKEKEQLEWLQELQRISADGAVLLMTVHSDATMCRGNLSRHSFERLQRHGFLDGGPDPSLDDVMANGHSYYRTTFHTGEYVRREWSKYFEILEIVPGYIGNHQDLVVMRKTS